MFDDVQRERRERELETETNSLHACADTARRSTWRSGLLVERIDNWT